ncbi:MAG: hypothetical protein AB7O57_18980 [Hyphomicrobiaceae bacterium]
MRTAVPIAILFGVMVAPSLSLASPGAGPVRFAEADAAVRPAPAEAQVIDPEKLAAFEDRVASFLAEFYLSGERRTDEELERLYAPSVDYFDNRRWTRARVLADKRAYFDRWPRRSYRLLRDTLKVERRPGAEKIYDVSFLYEFSVASPTRVSRGRGRALLTMDLSQDGGRITRETGVVITRY